MKTYLFMALASVAFCLGINDAAAAERIESPDGKIGVIFEVAPQGKPYYSVTFGGDTIVKPSAMGFMLGDGVSLSDGFNLLSAQHGSGVEDWTPVWGENDRVTDAYNSLIVELKRSGDACDMLMNVEFRVFNDGVGFRYVFPNQDMKSLVILDETTEMAMGGDYTAWWIPGDYDTQEYEYTESKLSEIGKLSFKYGGDNVSQSIFSPTGVQTSLLLRTQSGKYVNLHEAALVDFPAMHLNLDDSTLTFKAWLTPSRDGTKAVVNTPFATPWRVVMLSDDAEGILASNLIYNLNEPCRIADTSWITPVKFMGVWWEMIAGKSSWAYCDAENFDLATFDYSAAKPTGRHGANNENVRRYIDFAAEHGFDQLLVEGWNTGWEDWIGKEKSYVFDFQTPYPDFDIKALNDYAHSKGIRLMMHHETSGSIPNYEWFIDNAYDLMNRYGYNAVKSGYVGNILPKGENHYNQRAVKHYLEAVKKAAAKHIMVDAHEAVRPTGLARTYPNLLGNESAMGQEYRNMSPQHVTILPFTRLKGGPMDFTPGIFRMDLSTFVAGSNERKRATIANQLALYVTMYSPLQMAADLPEHYAEKADAFQFIKDVPVDWSKSIYLDAEPCEYIIAARRDKHSDDWYIGGVAAENGCKTKLKLDFLEPNTQYEATIYADAADADCDKNPEAYVISKRKVSSKSVIKVVMARGGGVAIRLTPIR